MPSSPRRAALIVLVCVAEPVGFEPTHGVCTVYSLSRGAPYDHLGMTPYSAHRAMVPVLHGTSRLSEPSFVRRSSQKRVEPVAGIEPVCPAWKAGVLPLNYTDIGAQGGV